MSIGTSKCRSLRESDTGLLKHNNMKYQYLDLKNKKAFALGTNQYQAKKKLKDSTYWNLLFLPLIFGLTLGVKTLASEISTPAHAQVISHIPKTPRDDEQKIVW